VRTSINTPGKFPFRSSRLHRGRGTKINLSPAADLLQQIGRQKRGLKTIRLSKGSGNKRTLSLQQMNRHLAVYNTRWWVVGLAVMVIFSGLRVYPQADAGGPTTSTGARYRTIAQLASIADIEEFGNPLNAEEYSVPLDTTGDYFFKTGGTDTIISRSSRKETIKYTVRSGETLNTLANDFGLTALTIKYANNLSSTTLKTGQELRIPPVDGLYVAVKKNDTLSSLASRYKVKVDDIQKYNGLTAGDPIHAGQELLIPGAVLPKAPTASSSGSSINVPAYNPIPYSGQFAWPTQSPTRFISQSPRRGHMAVDLNRLNGWGIYASAAGVVTTKTGYNGGYGNLITISHGSGWVTYYGHLAQFKVKSGDYVQQGQLIAIMGSTGRSTGPHVHFEIRHSGSLMNPLDYLPR
jgi:murein DD-endopeptidase MepM/ murein hydrolase activator NlpD